MSLFVIGDLHLALSDKSKPMDIFKGWENYMQLLEENWERGVGTVFSFENLWICPSM